MFRFENEEILGVVTPGVGTTTASTEEGLIRISEESETAPEPEPGTPSQSVYNQFSDKN